MKAFAALVLLTAWPIAAQSYTPESFASELGNLEAAIEQDPAVALSHLPSQWDVTTETRTYSISADLLRDLLAKPDRHAARSWVSQMRQHIESFRGVAAPNDVLNRKALEAILARPEFKDVAPPSAWDRFVARVRAWIADWLNRIFTYAAQHPTGSEILFWTLIVASVLALGAWLLRLWANPYRRPSLPDPVPMEHKLMSWQEWMAAARDAAAKGDHRQVIRCGYWAAIARLQSDRTIRINFTDTPRERLRLLALPSRRGDPLPQERLTPLTDITHSFERCWYAKLPVTGNDVTRTLENLEALGCKAD